ncbi:helix-turn-helix domain-containing protein [Dyadobacter luticola]|uniref:Helix-turn-helix domain-containing protein n=1 Tax=Dyadobacter luticola TaxID=1979387 RepID=A0A5R9L399_9BACT|nr:helix-turn-helix domain-containing protein [Dyadobacter luticola]TLV02888.1 helix-turn-helix domain-containing protein [Dyadobacter luticola]
MILAEDLLTASQFPSGYTVTVHKNFGELISRETLMQEIWINEAVFIGRSLDMFIPNCERN